MNSRASLGRRNKTGISSAQSAAAVAPVTRNHRPSRPRSRSQQIEGTGTRQVAPLSQFERVALLRQQALSEAHQGNYGEAISLFDCLLELSPNSARDYNNRGLVYFQSGQPEQAIADYNFALQLDPTLDSAYNNRANYFAGQGMYLEAILDYDAALDLNPTNTRAWINQGITFRDLQMYERAIECFDVAFGLKKLQSHVYAERGRTNHIRGDWNWAIADYHQALRCLNQPNATSPGGKIRLRQQIEGWLGELLG